MALYKILPRKSPLSLRVIALLFYINLFILSYKSRIVSSFFLLIILYCYIGLVHLKVVYIYVQQKMIIIMYNCVYNISTICIPLMSVYRQKKIQTHTHTIISKKHKCVSYILKYIKYVIRIILISQEP